MRLLLVLQVLLISFSTMFAQDVKKVGLCLSDLNADRWMKEALMMKEQFARNGVEFYQRIADKQPEIQYKQSIELMDMGCKVLIVVATNAMSVAKIVDEANERGVKVICYDRLILNCKPDYYVSFNNVGIGELQAKFALEKKPKGSYIVLTGPVWDFNAVLFNKGVMNVLKPHIKSGDVNLLFSPVLNAWNSMEVFSLMQDEFSNTDVMVDAIIGTQDKLASGAILYLEMFNKDMGKIVITGMDASLDGCRNIMEGKQAMSVFKPFNELVNQTVKITLSILKDKKVETNNTVNNYKIDVPSYLVDPVVITKDNMKELIVEKYKYWTAEDVLK